MLILIVFVNFIVIVLYVVCNFKILVIFRNKKKLDL